MATPFARLGRDRDVHHMPGVHVAGEDEVALTSDSSTAPSEGRTGFAGSVANIERDHGVGYDALDPLDRVEIGELEATPSWPSREPPLRVRRTHVDRLDRVHEPEGRGERRVEDGARDVARIGVGWDDASVRLENRPVPHGTVAEAQAPVGGRVLRLRRPAPGRTSPRRASITGRASSSPAASASSVDTPAPSIPSEASPRATMADSRAREASRPVPMTEASMSAGRADAWRRSASTSSNSVAGREVRSPSTSPSPTSALVATSVAVSNARMSTGDFL